MDDSAEDRLQGISIIKNMEDPLSWAEGKSGWVILQNDELDILKTLMETLLEPNVEEYNVSFINGHEKRQFYRLYVKNLLMAYKIIDISRKLKIHERLYKRKFR